MAASKKGRDTLCSGGLETATRRHVDMVMVSNRTLMRTMYPCRSGAAPSEFKLLTDAIENIFHTRLRLWRVGSGSGAPVQMEGKMNGTAE